MFTHLHVHTEYSLLDGLSRIKPLVTRAKTLGMDALAITDHGSMYGAIEFYNECKTQGIKPIIGCELYVAQKSRHDKTNVDKTPYHITVLSKNNEGYGNLIHLVTKAHVEGFYYKPRVDRELLEAHSQGLIILSGCLNGEIPRLLLAQRFDEAKETARWYKKVFPDFFLELQWHQNIPELAGLNEQLLSMSEEEGIPLVLTNDSHYVESEDASTQDILVCIQTNTTVNDQQRLKMSDESYYIKSNDEMASLFPNVPQAMENATKIADMCNLELDFSTLHLPQFYPPDGLTSEEYLDKLCWEGLSRRYPEVTPALEQRLKYELEVIKATQFPDYLLVVWDIATFAREQGILFGVRGSAAASLALSCLDVTDINPVEYDLVFERFLNLERKEMPDIDLDFQDNRRDEVIEYVSSKYGRDHVAQIITFGTLGPKAAIRDAGRALAMPYADVDRVARLIPFRIHSLDETLETIPEFREIYDRDPIFTNLIDTARKLEGVTRHASTHAAGVVISEEPLTSYVPLQRPVRGDEQGIAMTQFAMAAIAQLGLLKLDFLGLGNLTILGEARDLVTQAYDISLDLRTIPLDDSPTFDLLSSGETTGLFQVEGAGMRRYIKELRPSSLGDIAAMIALYRPGPMDHIDTFIKAKHGSTSIHYPHPDLEEILRDTYGVIVYQDQVLHILQRFAGYSLGEADIVRKAMGKKISELMRQEKENFIRGAQAKGHSQELSEQIFALIEPFAGYAFNKAHSVSYAMIAYWTAYFKANYPEEYLTALLNAQSGNTERIAAAVSECHRLKIPVLPPSINDSDVRFSVDRNYEGAPAIRFGLAAIKNVGSSAVEQIVQNRNQDGPFQSLDSFCRSIGNQGLNRRTLESLIKVGALDNFGDRGSILASLERILSLAQQEARLQNVGQSTMFDLFGETVATPLSSIVLEEDHAMPREKLSWEKELLGVYLSENPLSSFVAAGHNGIIVTKEQIDESLEGQSITLVGQISTIRQLMTKQQRQFVAANVELMDGNIEVMVWPEALERTRSVWTEGIFVQIVGKLRKRDDRLSLHCDQAHEFELPSGTPAIDIMPPQNNKPLPTLITSPYQEGGSILDQDNISSTSHINGDSREIVNGNGKTLNGNGHANHNVLIRLTETESPESDAQLLHEVLRTVLEFPGQDRVYLDIATDGTSVKLEMEQITTGFCDDLQTQIQSLLGGSSVTVE